MEGRSSRRGLNVGLTRELWDVFHTKCFGSAMRPRIAFSTKPLEREKTHPLQIPCLKCWHLPKAARGLARTPKLREINNICVHLVGSA